MINLSASLLYTSTMTSIDECRDQSKGRHLLILEIHMQQQYEDMSHPGIWICDLLNGVQRTPYEKKKKKKSCISARILPALRRIERRHKLIRNVAPFSRGWHILQDCNPTDCVGIVTVTGRRVPVPVFKRQQHDTEMHVAMESNSNLTIEENDKTSQTYLGSRY